MVEQPVVEVSEDKGSVLITCGGALDLGNSSRFAEMLKHASETAEKVTVDFRAVEFIDTAIVQYLATAVLKMKKRDAHLGLVVRPGSYVERVIDILGFGQLMGIERVSLVETRPS